MIVSAPASSANLGPGFDCLAVAIDLRFEVHVPGTDGDSGEASREATWPGSPLRECVGRHPARVAFEAAGGTGPLAWRSPIPPGRGMGFSGAARVAGAAAALHQQGADDYAVAETALEIAARLEGHADNAAASVHGGWVIAAGDRTVRLEVPLGLTILIWIPATETSTKASRAALPTEVALSDAAFNVAHTALLVASLCSGRWDLLAEATDDRLHQNRRLADQSAVREALDTFRSAGAAAWLSGSGPSVAVAAPHDRIEALRDQAPGGGTVRSLAIAEIGLRRDPDP